MNKYNIIKKFNNKLTKKEIKKIFKFTISLEELFIIHKLNYNINYFILSLPKTGNCYIYNSLRNITEDVCFFHSIFEFLLIDTRFINYSIKDIIIYISLKTKYDILYVIFSYREPLSRYISRYLWDVKIGINICNYLENIQEINNDELFEKIKNNDYSVLLHIYLNEFKLNLNNYKYDKSNGYTIIEYNNKIKFIFTKINDIDIFLKKFFNIDYNDKIFMNKNELNINKILFDKKFKDIIYDDEKFFLNFYNMNTFLKDDVVPDIAVLIDPSEVLPDKVHDDGTNEDDINKILFDKNFKDIIYENEKDFYNMNTFPKDNVIPDIAVLIDPSEVQPDKVHDDCTNEKDINKILFNKKFKDIIYDDEKDFLIF